MAATAPTSDDILGRTKFQTVGQGSSSAFQPDAPTAASVLGATSSVDPAALHPLAGLVDNKDLDYLLLDDEKLTGVEGGRTVLPNRGWGDELCYGTGSTYLAGLALGGVWGLREGLRKDIMPRNTPATAGATLAQTATAGTTAAPNASAIGSQAKAFAEQAAAAATAQKTSATASQGASAASPSTASAAQQQARRISRRLRWNHVLNQVTRRGSFTGNNAGVLALIYNGFNSTLDLYRGGKHDVYGSMAAAAATGALWRCTAGVKSMVITSGLLTAGAAGWSALKMQLL
ncbi:Mitochondrial import inner membrane translocase subunit tim23 [Microbotryomycetes sp. JL201]|nr:Mitochondrial import inner membrane translocase subunit tim23 [Microbotryomycetes sp. JL201]